MLLPFWFVQSLPIWGIVFRKVYQFRGYNLWSSSTSGLYYTTFTNSRVDLGIVFHKVYQFRGYILWSLSTPRLYFATFTHLGIVNFGVIFSEVYQLQGCITQRLPIPGLICTNIWTINSVFFLNIDTHPNFKPTAKPDC